MSVAMRGLGILPILSRISDLECAGDGFSFI